MPRIFDAGEDMSKKKAKYIVEGLIAKNRMINLLSQSGSGKTYTALALAVAVSLGEPFIGLPTIQSRVLYIDQDEQPDDTEYRLSMLMNYYNVKSTPNLQIALMEGLQVKDGTLVDTIRGFGNGLVIIDTLSAVTTGLRLSDPNDAQFYKSIYQEFINEKCDVTIIWLHHISEKKQLTLGDLMNIDPGELAMYSSKINQTVDGYYILFNPHKGLHNRELYLRPVTKRFFMKPKLLKYGMEQTEDYLHLTDAEEISAESKDFLTSNQRAMLIEIKEIGGPVTVKEMVEKVAKLMSENEIRTNLTSMATSEFLSLNKEGHNRFRYEITQKGLEALNIPDLEVLEALEGQKDDNDSKS